MSTRAHRQLLLLGLVFAGPLVLAVLAFYLPTDWIDRGSAAHGELIEPPFTLPPAALPTPDGGVTAPEWFRGRWLLIYVPGAGCADACLETLNRLNQVRLALGRDDRRTHLALLYHGEPPNLPAVPALTLAQLDSDAGQRWRDLLANGDVERFFIADPLGNVFMRYPASVEQADLLADLERLLEISQIGAVDPATSSSRW